MKEWMVHTLLLTDQEQDVRLVPDHGYSELTHPEVML